MEAWTEVAVKLFTRHQEETDIPENTRMQALNMAVDRGLKIYGDRISGENGEFQSISVPSCISQSKCTCTSCLHVCVCGFV